MFWNKKVIKKESYDTRFKWHPYYRWNKVELTGRWRMLEYKSGYINLEIEIIDINKKTYFIPDNDISIRPDPIETIFECTK